MACTNRCTAFTISGRRCKKNISRGVKEETGKNLCYIHYMKEKSAALKIEGWYYSLKYKNSVLKIENWYYQILSLKKKAAKIIQLAWLKYKNVRCPICFENFTKDNIIKTDCGHRFCKNCLKSTFDTKLQDLNIKVFTSFGWSQKKIFQEILRLNRQIGNLSCPMCRRNILEYDVTYNQPNSGFFRAIFVFKTDKYFTQTIPIVQGMSKSGLISTICYF